MKPEVQIAALISALVLGISGIVVSVFTFVPPTQQAATMTAVTAIAIPTITSLLAYLKGIDNGAKADANAKEIASVHKVVNDHTTMLERKVEVLQEQNTQATTTARDLAAAHAAVPRVELPTIPAAGPLEVEVTKMPDVPKE